MLPTHILCATDLLETGQHATAVASALARTLRAKLTLLHSADVDVLRAYSESPGFSSAARDKLVARIRERVDTDRGALRAERDRCAALGIETETLLQDGRPWEAILHGAERAGADLIVVGEHAAHAKAPRILGTTADRVVRHAKLPVLVTSGTGPEKFEGCRFVVGVDFSAHSARAIEVAAEWAKRLDGHVDLVHVLPPSVPESGGPDDLVPLMESAALAELERWASERSVHATRHVLSGNPADALASHAAATDADVLVVGTRGHSRIGELVLGSTTERTLEHSPIPVLAIGPHRTR
jgi:nucleotide-binding universal stress UspA family protein